MSIARDGSRIAMVGQPASGEGNHPVLNVIDLETGSVRPITSHGDEVGFVTFDATGKMHVSSLP